MFKQYLLSTHFVVNEHLSMSKTTGWYRGKTRGAFNIHHKIYTPTSWNSLLTVHMLGQCCLFPMCADQSLIVEQITSEVLIKKIPMLRSNLLFSDFRMWNTFKRHNKHSTIYACMVWHKWTFLNKLMGYGHYFGNGHSKFVEKIQYIFAFFF